MQWLPARPALFLSAGAHSDHWALPSPSLVLVTSWLPQRVAAVRPDARRGAPRQLSQRVPLTSGHGSCSHQAWRLGVGSECHVPSVSVMKGTCSDGGNEGPLLTRFRWTDPETALTSRRTLPGPLANIQPLREGSGARAPAGARGHTGTGSSAPESGRGSVRPTAGTPCPAPDLPDAHVPSGSRTPCRPHTGHTGCTRRGCRFRLRAARGPAHRSPGRGASCAASRACMGYPQLSGAREVAGPFQHPFQGRALDLPSWSCEGLRPVVVPTAGTCP